MGQIATLIDEALTHHNNETVIAGVKKKVHELMAGFPLYA